MTEPAVPYEEQFATEVQHVHEGFDSDVLEVWKNSSCVL